MGGIPRANQTASPNAAHTQPLRAVAIQHVQHQEAEKLKSDAKMMDVEKSCMTCPTSPSLPQHPELRTEVDRLHLWQCSRKTTLLPQISHSSCIGPCSCCFMGLAIRLQFFKHRRMALVVYRLKNSVPSSSLWLLEGSTWMPEPGGILNHPQPSNPEMWALLPQHCLRLLLPMPNCPCATATVIGNNRGETRFARYVMYQAGVPGRRTRQAYQAGVPGRRTRQAYQAGVPGRHSRQAYQVGVPSRRTRQAYQAGVPGRRTRQAYQAGVPGRRTRQAYQAGVPGRRTRQAYQPVIAASHSRQAYQAGVPGRRTRQAYQAGVPGRRTRQAYQAGVQGRRTRQAYQAGVPGRHGSVPGGRTRRAYQAGVPSRPTRQACQAGAT